MKKKLLFIIGLVAAALFAPNAYAKSDPIYYENFANNKEIFFANGTPITIEERTDGVEGALIKWDGGQQLVTSEVGVFGGYHNNTADKVDTSITMNGGTVRNIIGGGLHASEVGTAEITLNGGTVAVAIYGGGYDGYVWGGEHCTCSNKTNTAETAKDSNVRVDNVVIKIKGGSVTYVMGGGGGYNYVGTTSVTINNLDTPANYVVAAGTNGYTGSADLTVNGGEIETVKGAMRGTTEDVEILITNGTVENVYAAAPSEIDSENATVNKTSVMITGGDITSVSTGTSGTNNETATEAELIYDEDVVDETVFANGGFKTENLNTTVTLTIDILGTQTETEIPKSYIFSDAEFIELTDAISEALMDTDYEFRGYYADADYTIEFDWYKPIDTDTTLYVEISEVQYKDEDESDEDTTVDDEVSDTTENENNDKVNPDTSDINVLPLIITLLVGSLGLGYTIKNKKFN